MAAALVLLLAGASKPGPAQNYPNKPVWIVVSLSAGGLHASGKQGSRLGDAHARASGPAARNCATASSSVAYPNKPIRIVVSFAAGGPIDLVTRPVAQKLNEALGSSVVVENRAGGDGTIGLNHVARAPADGYTLAVASGGSFAIRPHLSAKTPFDVFSDFAPIILLATLPELLAIHPALPVQSVKQLVALAKARPKQLNFGSAGAGGMTHVSVALLMQATASELTHVPYKGMGPATIDLIGGHVQLAFADLPVLLPHIKSGKLRALAVGSPNRSPNLPDVPTTAEAGFPSVEAYNWYGLFGPAAMPKDVVARLNAELVKALSSSDLRTLMQGQGAEAAGGTPEQLGMLHRKEFDKWGTVVRTAGIRIE
jgi:tripartite-type tricarboxylate transporter receptor subunit TctC